MGVPRNYNKVPRSSSGKFLPQTVKTEGEEPKKQTKARCLHCGVQIRSGQPKTQRFSDEYGKYIDAWGIPIDLALLQRDGKAGFFHSRCASNARTDPNRPKRKSISHVYMDISPYYDPNRPKRRSSNSQGHMDDSHDDAHSSYYEEESDFEASSQSSSRYSALPEWNFRSPSSFSSSFSLSEDTSSETSEVEELEKEAVSILSHTDSDTKPSLPSPPQPQTRFAPSFLWTPAPVWAQPSSWTPAPQWIPSSSWPSSNV